MNIIVLIALLTFCQTLSSAARSDKKVLILLDSLDLQSSHSRSLQNIKSKGYDVTVASIDAKSITLQEWDTWLFDKLVIFGGEKGVI